jgi:hypothetical protein
MARQSSGNDNNLDHDHIEQVRITVLPDGRINRANAAIILDRNPKTLAEWKSKGLGPPQFMVGGRVFYWLSDVLDYRDGGAEQ